MRVREIIFNNFRSFRGERRISFVDPLTDTVRPISVLAGSNGTGKTTILEAIEALLEFVLNNDNPKDLVIEAWETGLICLALEIFPGDVPPDKLEKPAILHIAVGRRDLAPSSIEEAWPNVFSRLVSGGIKGRSDFHRSPLAESLFGSVLQMSQGMIDTHGGLLYFPHDRQLQAIQKGPIEPPKEEFRWNFRFSPTAKWQGSLEQLWVWQNYLDLEQSAPDRNNLSPFVTTVEGILGENRRIAINEGRVLVPTAWRENGDKVARVGLDKLPSGEQQVLLLFGELARYRRRGAVIAIDEVENCLHPTLQRLVMWNLRKLAREWDAQVIVATHSLEVINAVRGGAFVNLDYPENHFNLPVPENLGEDPQ